MFIERFWGSLAQNCPAGESPARDQFLARVVEANDKFADEGIPGWLTDRGRVHILLGPPASEVKKGAGAGAVLIWSWAEAPDRPKTVAFVRDRLQWAFAAEDQVDPAADSVTARQIPLAPSVLGEAGSP